MMIYIWWRSLLLAGRGDIAANLIPLFWFHFLSFRVMDCFLSEGIEVTFSSRTCLYICIRCWDPLGPITALPRSPNRKRQNWGDLKSTICLLACATWPSSHWSYLALITHFISYRCLNISRTAHWIYLLTYILRYLDHWSLDISHTTHCSQNTSHPAQRLLNISHTDH